MSIKSSFVLVRSLKNHLNFWLRLFKGGNFILIRHDLYMKFCYFFMKFEIFLFKFIYIKSYFLITYLKFRSKALWAFHNKFPQGLFFRIGKYRIEACVNII